MSNKRTYPLNRSIIIACLVFIVLLSCVMAVITYRIYKNTLYARYRPNARRPTFLRKSTRRYRNYLIIMSIITMMYIIYTLFGPLTLMTLPS